MIGLFQHALSEISTQLTPLLLLWKINFGQQMRGDIIEFYIIKQIKKPRLCSVLLQNTWEVVQFPSSSFYCSTLFSEKLINIVYKNAEIKKYKQISQRKIIFTVTKKWGKTLDSVLCFPLHFFCALALPACFTTEQRAVEASFLLILNQRERKVFPCNITVNDICRPLISHCYGNIFGRISTLG